jgi:isoquinoline 1-oxidoreductase beta subunit
MFVQRDEGASVMGLTLAQYGEITYKNGRVEQGNFNDFQLARINGSPTETRVRIVEHGIDVPASGVGEPASRRLPIGNQLSI